MLEQHVMSCMLVNENAKLTLSNVERMSVRSDVTPGAQWSRLASSSHM